MSRSNSWGEKSLVVYVNEEQPSFSSALDSLIGFKVHGDCDTFVTKSRCLELQIKEVALQLELKKLKGPKLVI